MSERELRALATQRPPTTACPYSQRGHHTMYQRRAGSAMDTIRERPPQSNHSSGREREPREACPLTLGSGSAGPVAEAAIAMHRMLGRGRAAARRPGARTAGEGERRRRRSTAAGVRAAARVAVAADMEVGGAAGKVPRASGAACACGCARLLVTGV